MVRSALSARGGWAVGVAIDAAEGPRARKAGWQHSSLMGGAILVGPLALWVVTAPVGNCEAVQVHGAGCDPAIG